MNGKKIVIVHDWLYGGGAEKVVLELHRMFPEAPIYTSYTSKAWRDRLDNKVITGYLQKWPFSSLRKFLPLLRQWWFARLDLSEYDIIISSSGNGEAKFVRTNKKQIHICYCHTPTHFYWRHYDSYIERPSVRPKWLARWGLKLLVKPLRQRDYEAAQGVDRFIANSTHIKHDIKQYYDRCAEVVFPPVDTARFATAKAEKRQGYVTHGRQVPHKRFDIIVEACNQLKLPLTVIGNGPEHNRLKRLAGPTVTLRNDVGDTELAELLGSAEGYIFASYEDFGIAPVEAMAAGTPVIACEAGGALDYVIDSKTGMFFGEQTTESLTQTLEQFSRSPDAWNHDYIATYARAFSAKSFEQQICATIKSIVREHRGK